MRFLPAVYQPNVFRAGKKPVLNLDLPTRRVARSAHARRSGLIRELDQARMSPGDEEFTARMNTYDLAFKMQTEAPAVFDISQGAAAHPGTVRRRRPGHRRLRAPLPAGPPAGRKGRARGGGGLAEARRVSQWDAHDDIEENHLRMAAHTDKPIAGLLKDLKQRGLLDSTLVVWGGEFGRTPEGPGRQRPRPQQHRLHHVDGRRRRARRHGRRAPPTRSACAPSKDPHHLRDIHTTVLYQMGLDQNALSLPAPGPPRAPHRNSRRGHPRDCVEPQALGRTPRSARDAHVPQLAQLSPWHRQDNFS